jgi:drug/metabolite transporter (DMT)-like permease
MSDLPNPKQQNLILGAAFLAVAMLTIPGLDAIAKYLSVELSPLYISWARYTAASIIILPIAMIKFGVKDLAFVPKRNIKSHFIRTFFIVSAMACYFIALATTPIATATAITMIAPIVATVAAVFLLGEKLTKLKIIALVFGFVGAMIIIQPSSDMESGVIFAAMTGFFYGGYIVTTRQMAQARNPLRTLTFQCVMGAMFLTPFALIYWELPTQSQLLFIFAMGLISVFCHGLTLLAFQYAQASALSPLVYLEIVSAAIFGYLVFADVPTITFWIGTGFIVFAGIVVSMSREPRSD